MNDENDLTLFWDYLDGLLDGEAAREAEERIRARPERLAEAARMRARLYRPYPLPEQPPATPHPIRRRPKALLRYAAAFAAGLLVAALANFGAGTPRKTRVLRAAENTPAPAQPETIIFNRRIR